MYWATTKCHHVESNIDMYEVHGDRIEMPLELVLNSQKYVKDILTCFKYTQIIPALNTHR